LLTRREFIRQGSEPLSSGTGAAIHLKYAADDQREEDHHSEEEQSTDDLFVQSAAAMIAARIVFLGDRARPILSGPVRINQALRITPAMAAGISDTLWPLDSAGHRGLGRRRVCEDQWDNKC
jgi:hypothetical protein